MWNLIAGGDVVAVAREPRTKSEGKALRARLDETYAQRDRQDQVPFERFDRVRLLASWFRQHPGELQQAMTPDQAKARCRAGAAI